MNLSANSKPMDFKSAFMGLNKTNFTDVLCDRAQVWHLRGGWLLVVCSYTRCPQAELLGESIQLQAVDIGLLSHLFILTELQDFPIAL